MVKKIMMKVQGSQAIDFVKIKNQDNAHQHLMSTNFRNKRTTKPQAKVALFRTNLQK